MSRFIVTGLLMKSYPNETFDHSKSPKTWHEKIVPDALHLYDFSVSLCLREIISHTPLNQRNFSNYSKNDPW